EMLETQAAAGPGEQVEAAETGTDVAVESSDNPEGPAEVRDASATGEASEGAAVHEEPEQESSEASELTNVGEVDPLDSPGTADARELPGEETPRHSVEGGDVSEGSEDNVEK